MGAPFSGTASNSTNSLGGLSVTVTGADGYVYNAHLSAFGALGSVSTGTVVGYVGNSGDAQGGDVVPIPGTKRRTFLEENLAAAPLTLSAADLARIEQVAPKGAAHGQRYPEAAMGLVNG